MSHIFIKRKHLEYFLNSREQHKWEASFNLVVHEQQEITLIRKLLLGWLHLGPAQHFTSATSNLSIVILLQEAMDMIVGIGNRCFIILKYP